MQPNHEANDGPPVQVRNGLAKLTRASFEGKNLGRVASQLLIAIAQDETNGAALMDLSVCEQLHGNLNAGLSFQAAALEKCQLYQTGSAVNPSIRVLVLAAPIHFGGNTPIEFLLENSTVSLSTLYVIPGLDFPNPLPEHDILFVAAPGDSDHARSYLLEINDRIKNWPRPVINSPNFIAGLERDQLFESLAGVSNLICPTVARIDRAELEVIANGHSDVCDALSGLEFPLVIRPVGSHAGRNLEKMHHASDIKTYFRICSEPEFFLTRFVDYSSDDGQYRKYRIIFVNGCPFPCHMAIADQWKVWYLNAGMDRCAQKRDEEAEFMTNFEKGFWRRHERTLSEIAGRVQLEYFGIDCAEDRDGRLVLFEADNALIVHDMDSPALYPYKLNPIHRIYDAFVEMLIGRAAKNPYRTNDRLV